MGHPFQRFYFIFLTVLIFGCAVQQVYLDRAIIRNETGSVISEVRVSHEPTGRIGQVHSILPNSAFELGFSAGPMLARKSVITWESQDGQRRRVKLELPQYHRGMKHGETFILVYTILPNGRATVALED